MKPSIRPTSSFLFAVSVALASTAAFAKPAKPPKISALRIEESYTVDAVEISGMAWRTNPETKRRELVIVGDRDYRVHFLDWDRRKAGLAPRTVDLRPIVAPEAPADSQSQWESVFSDESGRLFVVQEDPSRIVVISADLKKVEGRIALRFPPTPSDVPGEDGNSGGEGLLPLANGHVLVVKEKDPLKVLEFAPKGRPAEGYARELAIERSGKFPFVEAPSAEFVSVFEWRLAPEHETLFEDSSGLNVDPDGTLYLLGDQKGLVGRVGKKLKAGKDRVRLDRLWSLPSTIRQAEGMTIDPEHRPIVAVDRKNTKRPNLFLLSAMK